MTSKVKSSMNRLQVDDSDSWDSLSVASGLSDEGDLQAEYVGQEEEAAFTSNNTTGFAEDEAESVTSSSLAGERPKQLVRDYLLTSFYIFFFMRLVRKCDSV